MIKKMNEIKSMPPDKLEIELKKAMAEKKKKEDEEKYIQEIKLRQKIARKVKKEQEKKAKAEEKAKKKEAKKRRKSENKEQEIDFDDNEDDDDDDDDDDEDEDVEDEEEELDPSQEGSRTSWSHFKKGKKKAVQTGLPAFTKVIPKFKSTSFAEVHVDPSVEAVTAENFPVDDDNGQDTKCSTPVVDEPKTDGEDILWPAGALQEYGEEAQEAEEEDDDEIPENRYLQDEKFGKIQTTSKIFSKVRSRIKAKPLKIHLKTTRLSTDEGTGLGLNPGGVTIPTEGMSEQAPRQGSEEYGEGEYDGYEYQYNEDGEFIDMTGEDYDENYEYEYEYDPQDSNGQKESRRRKQSEVEDGEMSETPSPDPEKRSKRHHRSRRSRGGPVSEPGLGPQRAPPGFVDPDTGMEEGEICGGDDAIPVVSMNVNIPDYLQRPPPGLVPPPHLQEFPHLQRPPPHMQLQGPPPLMQGPPPNMQGPPPSQHYPHVDPSLHARGHLLHPTHLQEPPPNYNQPPPAPEWPRSQSYPEERNPSDYSGYPPLHRPGHTDGFDSYMPPPPPVPIFHPDFDSDSRYVDGPPTQNRLAPKNEDAINLTDISPIMKFVAKKLEERGARLELSGPFIFREDTPGVSRYLFVAYKMVGLLEKAGYDSSKMYMAAMFPAGIKDLKSELKTLVYTGKLDDGIKGKRLTKTAIHCIKCFVSYYTGTKADDDSSDEADSNDEVQGTATSNKSSLVDFLGRINDSKHEEDTRYMGQPVTDPLSRVLDSPSPPPQTAVQVKEEPPWPSCPTMDAKIKHENCKTFTALQNYIYKHFVGKHEQRAAWNQSQDYVMCLVVAGYNDSNMRDTVGRYVGTVLPERHSRHLVRIGSEMTLFDLVVAKLLRHQAEFPLSMIQEAQTSDDWQETLSAKVRDITARVLKFYQKGCGKLAENETRKSSLPPNQYDHRKSNVPPPQYQFNNMRPDGPREENRRDMGRGGLSSRGEGPFTRGGGLPQRGGGPPQRGPSSNFFSMEAAAELNRSLDCDAEPGLPPARYMFGTLYINTVIHQGSSYVYEMGVHFADSASLEVYIIPNRLFRNKQVLEMIGFSFNQDEDKYVYIKQGGGLAPSFDEERGLGRLINFLKERRNETRGDSKNSGLVLATQTMEDLSTWIKFTKHHGREGDLEMLVGGYGCIDMLVEEMGGKSSYVGPRLHKEPARTFYTWEFKHRGRYGESMATSKGAALFDIVENLLGGSPSYSNLYGVHCFPVKSGKIKQVERRTDIIKDLYNLEIYLANNLNSRGERRRLCAEGVFSARSEADLIDKSGLVALRLVRLLAELGLSKPVLKDRVMEARERGTEFLIPVQTIVGKMGDEGERGRCVEQIRRASKYVEDYFFRR